MSESQANTNAEVTPTETKTETTPQYVSKYVGEGKTFKDQSALEEAYSKLQGEYTKLKQGKVETKSETPTATETSKTEAQDFTRLFPTLVSEIKANNGKLSEQSVEVLATQFGLSKPLAAKFEKFVAAEVQEALSTVEKQIKDAGVNLPLNDVLSEAGKYYSPAQLKKIQEAIDMGFSGVIVDVAKTVAANRKTPAAIGQVASTTSSGEGFSSAEDIHKAVNSKQFGYDMAYTKGIEAKLRQTAPAVVKEFESYGKNLYANRGKK